MQLYYTDEVPAIPEAFVCRQRKLGVTLGSLLFIAVFVGIPVVLWVNEVSIWFIGFAFLFTMLIVPMVLRSLIGVHRSSNWVMKVDAGGVWLNFRSYMHYQFENAESVVFVGYDEIEKVYEQSEIKIDPGIGDSESRDVRVRSLILELTHTDTEEFKAALRAENNRRETTKRFFGLVTTSSRQGHVVLMLKEGNRIEIPWKDPRSMGNNVLSPKLEGALEHLRYEVKVDEPLHRQKKGKDQEAELLELIEEDRSLYAIKMARQIYGFDLKEAKEFVEAVKSKQSLSDGSSDGT